MHCTAEPLPLSLSAHPSNKAQLELEKIASLSQPLRLSSPAAALLRLLTDCPRFTDNACIARYFHKKGVDHYYVILPERAIDCMTRTYDNLYVCVYTVLQSVVFAFSTAAQIMLSCAGFGITVLAALYCSFPGACVVVHNVHVHAFALCPSRRAVQGGPAVYVLLHVSTCCSVKLASGRSVRARACILHD